MTNTICEAHSRWLGLTGVRTRPGGEEAALGSPDFALLVSYRVGMDPDHDEVSLCETLESLCVSSALRTEFHRLCQCQTYEV